ncbi:hypothetical protein HK104_006589 [Borealophlyctis nickersoniae]|nr:hypothetical protein HK104_006589 [Borealophlyctis nickersoniae]
MVVCCRRARTLPFLFSTAAFLFLFTTTLLLYRKSYQLKNTISYITRPLWDTPEYPTNILPHYYAPGIPQSTLCNLHNWTVLPSNTRPPKVYDAILFSLELDLLEIRLRELYDVVDTFIILESGTTFTGMSKPLLFSENRARFDFAADKILYSSIPGRTLAPHENPFFIENEMRVAMNALIASSNISTDDWIIMSDVDEIPAAHTISLITHCHGVPSPLHLQLRNYIYSFEFHYDDLSWRAQVHRYDPLTTAYKHSKSTDTMLADAGWHCSFCFRYLQDVAFKMRAYSHSDRMGMGPESKLLDPRYIQDVICRGADVFGMLPEAYEYRELVAKWGDLPKQKSAVGLPRYLVEMADRFRFLLPGGCMREDAPGNS